MALWRPPKPDGVAAQLGHVERQMVNLSSRIGHLEHDRDFDREEILKTARALADRVETLQAEASNDRRQLRDLQRDTPVLASCEQALDVEGRSRLVSYVESLRRDVNGLLAHLGLAFDPEKAFEKPTPRVRWETSESFGQLSEGGYCGRCGQQFGAGAVHSKIECDRIREKLAAIPRHRVTINGETGNYRWECSCGALGVYRSYSANAELDGLDHLRVVHEAEVPASPVTEDRDVQLTDAAARMRAVADELDLAAGSLLHAAAESPRKQMRRDVDNAQLETGEGLANLAASIAGRAMTLRDEADKLTNIRDDPEAAG